MQQDTTSEKPKEPDSCESPTDSQPAPPPTPTVFVNATSKAVFERLFAANPTSKKPMHFNDFAAAMIDAGFSAEHAGRCSGSAVTFKSERNGPATITFHQPHPDPKVDHNKLRTWGKRLNQKFGWELESFVERSF